ncbi:MAG: hypothetical protein HY545_02815 [Candidatus Doudnabacteria bacterium]|nr:hypothetical protein [Candidatus Doudnabacteria bacterium]
MINQIEQILRELYQIDPSLQQHEEQVIAAISRILEARPDTKFDQVFAQNLRHQLMHAEPAVPVKEKLVEIRHDFFKRLSFAGSLAAVFIVVIAATLFINNRNGNELSFFSPGVKITSAGERAFGELTEVSKQDQAATEEKAAVPVGIGGGGVASTPGLDQPSPLLPPVPEFVYYKYVYKGESLDLSNDKRQVFKRLRGDAISADLNGILNNLGVGLINLRSFNNSKLQSIAFVEEGNNGYAVSVDVQNGSISIYGYWPELYSECGSGISCPVPARPFTPLTPADVPDDAALIGIANDFLSAHNVPLLAYAAPEVGEWKLYYELSKKQGYPYLPEIITVVYPLKINEQVVLDESGNKTGLMVGVDIRNKRVSSVYDLSAQSYQASTYDAETDTAKIIKVAERGGVYGYYPPECSSPPVTPEGRPVPSFQTCKVVEIELGAPTIELIKMWNYKNNESQELLIPSLVFPLINPPEELAYRKSVIVPLIKEILDNQMYPMPMPLLKPEAAQ